MDPNLFHIDWERTIEALLGIIVLSFFVERVAALLFESKGYVRLTKMPEDGSAEDIRERKTVNLALEIIEKTKAFEGQNDPQISPEDYDDIEGFLKGVSAELEASSRLFPLDWTDPKLACQRAKDALAVIEDRQNRRMSPSVLLPWKEGLAFLLAAAICFAFRFDAISIIFLTGSITTEGTIITAAVVAGGSKASIKLFHDVLGVKSRAVKEVTQARKENERLRR